MIKQRFVLLRNSFKKLFFISILISIISQLFASDVISIDSLFKKEKKDIRLTTSFDIISANGTRTFSTYPIMLSYDDGTLVTETQKIILGQTLMYGLNNSFDIFLSYNVINNRVKYTDFSSLSLKSDNNTKLDSLFIGINYTFNTLLFDEFQ